MNASTSEPVAIDLEEIDVAITEHGTYADPRHHDMFRVLRDLDPVRAIPANRARDLPAYWAVTRYQDCLTVLRDPELFTQRAGTQLLPRGGELSAEQKFALGIDYKPQSLDPPRHTSIRRPLNKHFSVPVVNRMRGAVQQVVDEILGGLATGTDVEIVDRVSTALPVGVFLRLMDVPHADWDYIRGVTARIGQPTQAAVSGSADPTQIYLAASQELHEYLLTHIAAKRTAPGSDLASLVGLMEVDGQLLDLRAAAWTAWNIVSGGLETTRGALSVGIYELIRNPDQAKQVAGDVQVAQRAAEEAVRWTTPSRNRLRVASRDTVLGDRRIHEGDWVVAWISSANRDERVFARANTFDATREDNPHLGFGEGIHMCLGRNVARLEMTVLFHEFFRRFTNSTLLDEPTWLASDTTSAITNLSVRVA